MNLEQTTHHFVGEIRLINGRMSMCVMADADFGGGHGDRWITEDHIYDFALKDERTIMRGICRNIDVKNKSFLMEIVEGPTWGRYCQGGRPEIEASQLTHLRPAAVHGPKLIEESQLRISQIRANAAFERISLKELEQAAKCDHEEAMRDMLGVETFAFTKAVLGAYVQLCQSYVEGTNGYRMPSPSESKAKHQIASLFKAIKEGR